MEGGGIIHRTVEVNGIKMHVAEKGEGPVVLFLHGFPELWYSWRHQILSLAARGYRAVAPDLRGYGDTEAPPDIAAYSIFHIVGDIVALIDSLGEGQVFVVGHDWGAQVAWNLCAFRPDKVKALVNLSAPFMERNPDVKPVDGLRAGFGEDLYISRFQEPGKVETHFARIDTLLLMKILLTSFSPKPLLIADNGSLGRNSEEIRLPSWLSEHDIDYFASKFSKTGFTGGINYYRNLNRNWELLAPWTGIQITVPTKFITGDEDLTYHMAAMKDYIEKGGFKRGVPLLEDVIIMKGIGHFINQEKPEEISEHIYNFFKKF
ncbi:uncharacterized protein LOC110022184 [Phalaenopsis equestris]|uniref:uncharacterized protein LOC110022184 n=2 Tax=Phalaenopsis equestris TaxID=78828 RepID=UPI0009E2F3A7|nr:uncharacterized protein LOC110022184 [Phalaenopsis equestris]